MPKQFFTSSAAILLSKPVGLDEIERALGAFTIARRDEGRPSSGRHGDWMGSYPFVMLAMRPEVNGYVVVDVVDRPWPDSMMGGTEEPTLFAAWAMQWFGPFVAPEALSRAAERSPAWPEASIEAAGVHQAFI